MRYIIPAIVVVVLFVYGLIDCLRSDRNDVRGISKTAWVLVIVLLNVVGVALWFLFGRPRYAASVGAARTAGPAGRGSFPAGHSGAPDDDPEFLRALAVKRAQKLEDERLRKLKAELDEREAKLREQHPNDETKK